MDKLLMLAGGPQAVRTVLDVGANDGTDSLPFAIRFPHIRFIAIEPTPDLARRLGLKSWAIKNYTVVPCAIGATDGESVFKIRRSSLHNSLENINRPSLDSVSRAAEEYEVLQEVVVSVRTLKSLCADLNVEAIDVLHVDAQGSDLEVLRSAGEILQTVKAGVVEAGKRLQLYTNTAARPEIIWFLTKRGFRIVRVVPNDRFNFEQNVFFIPSRHRRVWTVIHALMQMVLADVSLWLGKRSPLNRLAVRASLTLRHRARQIREARPDKSNKGS